MTPKAAIEKPVKRNAADRKLPKPKEWATSLGGFPNLKHRDHIRDFPEPIGHASRHRGRDLECALGCGRNCNTGA
jgi:hypothetical protein